MFRRLVIIVTMLCIASVGASAWGRLGHMTIAEIAQRHLTPRAAERINHYTGGEPLASFAVYLDEYRNKPYYKERYSGWHASIALPDCTSPLYVRDRERGMRDAVTAVEYFEALLSGEYQNMPDSSVFEAIKCITHMIGDFHCPQHIRFTDNRNDGKFNVTFCGQEYTYHTLWDMGLIVTVSGRKSKDYRLFADELDTWNRRQIRKAVGSGSPREWFEDAARDVRPMLGSVKKGDALDMEWAETAYPLALLEIRKAGYQLADILNRIFG